MKRNTYDYVKSFIENKHPGSKLISTEYINNRHKLMICCENNHRIEMSFSSIVTGKWCKECLIERNRRKFKYNYSYIKNYIESKHPGSFLISKEYNNNREKLDIICENGHKISINFANITCDNWCKYCAKNRPLDINKFTEWLKKHHPNSILLDDAVYSTKKINIICENGHKFSSLYGNIVRKNQWCSICAGNKKYTLNDVKEFLFYNYKGCEVISKEYVNVVSKLKLICPNKHCFDMSLDCLHRGQRCYYCGESGGEKYCRELFEEYSGFNFPKIRPYWLKNPETGYNLELDGYCEHLSMAFEYNGIQHYKQAFYMTKNDLIKQKNRDRLKSELCYKNNVLLVVIPYYMISKKTTLHNLIRNACKNRISTYNIPILY